MNIIYRQGRKADSLRIAELDYIASGGADEYLFHDLIEGASATQVVAYSLEQDQYPHTFRSAIVAECDARVIGMALSYPAKFHDISEEMREFFPPQRLQHFQAFFSTRVEGSYLLDALCVDEAYRNQGIGKKLIALTKQKAIQEGYDTLSLIVFADNHAAQRLYRQNGFETVQTIELKRHELIPHDGGCLLMKANLQSRSSNLTGTFLP